MSRKLLSGLVFAFIAQASTYAATITVCWDGSGDMLSIQEGLNAAWSGDEVVVCDGVYTGIGNRDLDFQGQAITLRSGNQGLSALP